MCLISHMGQYDAMRMAWGKSRHEQGRAAAPVDQDSSRLADRVLLTLISQTEQINARLTLLEDRFDASMVAGSDAPAQANLGDLRAQTERLASELSDVSAALLGETVQPSEPDIDLTDQTLRLDRPDNGWRPHDD